MRKAKHKLWSEYLWDLYSLCEGRQCFWLLEDKCTPKHKIKNYRRYALNSCQPKSRIHSQQVGNAKPNSFKSYLNLAFYEGWISLTGLLLLSVEGQNSSGCSFTRTLLVYSILKFIGALAFYKAAASNCMEHVFIVPICNWKRVQWEQRWCINTLQNNLCTLIRMHWFQSSGYHWIFIWNHFI